MLSLFILSSVMCWTKDHDLILCREVANVNPYMTKKGSTQRSSIWEKIADTLNKCSVPKFFVDKRSVRDHVGILVNRHKKKLRDEEKASGITPDLTKVSQKGYGPDQEGGSVSIVFPYSPTVNSSLPV